MAPATGTTPAEGDRMTAVPDTLPRLARRAEELASEMLALAERAAGSGQSTPSSVRRAVALAARGRALAAALWLADDDDVLTVAKELAALEDAGRGILVEESDTVRPPPTLRPPPSASGTFWIERKKASTNRLLAVRG